MSGARANADAGLLYEAFDAYLRDHAPAMRADGVARFGTRFRAERRVLDLTLRC